MRLGTRRDTVAASGNGHAGVHWVKSSLSFSNGACVEVADLPDGGIAMRDSKNAEGPILRFTWQEWRAFLSGAKMGAFDSIGR